jgi:aryl-alcohol dehydrogenase-like predicted oxidoreductase
MNFSVTADERESFAIMDRALELGINFFDTANVYGKPLRQGVTEELIGRWFAQGGGRREQVVLGTKLFSPIGPGINDRGLSAYHIRRACTDSLRRLKTEHIDLYQMHHIDRGRPTASQMNWFGTHRELTFPPHIDPAPQWEEVWQGMEQLIREGKITYVGSSNFAGWNIAQANERAGRRGLLGIVSEQSVYNLAKRIVELEVVPACRAYGVGLLCWSPLASGLLAGALREAVTAARRVDLELSESQRAQVQRYHEVCRDLGEEPATIALAWLLHNPVVTAPIIGPRTIEQLESAIRALQVTLDAEILRRLDETWPGPGNQAPEAYAW